jgi:hypothetical protein
MITPDPAPGAARGVADADRPDVVKCPVCPHPTAAHDAIGARFCRATIAKALARGCVCSRR